MNDFVYAVIEYHKPSYGNSDVTYKNIDKIFLSEEKAKEYMKENIEWYKKRRLNGHWFEVERVSFDPTG